MKRNSRLSLALHTLSHMAAEPKRIQTSAAIATHVGTNPVVVRRVLGKLKSAGILNSKKGHGGGWHLGRPPEDISLADIYLALGEKLLASDREEPVHQCSFESACHDLVFQILRDVENTLIDRLASKTIMDVGVHSR